MPKNPLATIHVTGFAEPIVLELYPAHAPNTVKNFISLANKNFYDGLIFHRIIRNFMIQGGGSEKPVKTIKGEFQQNGHANPIPHERGVISMARTQVPDSATSQFFIVHKDSPHLNGLYAAFGKMVSGYETLDQIAAVRTGFQDRPVQDVAIASVRVDTFGVEYEEAVHVR